MEAAGHRRTVMDVRNILLGDRQNTDRIPLLFRLRGYWWRFHDTLVSSRGRSGKPDVRWWKHMFVLVFLFSHLLCLCVAPQSCMRQRWLCTCTLSSRVSPDCRVPAQTRVRFWRLGPQLSFPDLKANFVTVPEYATEISEPLKTSTLELASSHLVCSVALTGVLALQAGRWWAENNNDPDN